MLLLPLALLSGAPGTEAAPVAAAPAAVPAAPKIDLQLAAAELRAATAGEPGAAALLLARVDQELAERPEEARAAGFDYLRGRLLAASGERAAAIFSLTDSQTATPALAPWASYHLALLHEQDGQVEAAAAQASRVLASRPPRPLLERALELFARNVAGGGDCRWLAVLPALQWKPEELRYLAWTRAECARRAGRIAESDQALLAILEAKATDDPALLAATSLAQRLDPAKAPGRTLLLVGTSFYEHRDFVKAIGFLNLAVARLVSGRDVPAPRYWQARYALGRSLFWLERYSEAEIAFEALARSSTTAGERSQALFQKGRSLELLALDPRHAARREDAVKAYGEILQLVPLGRWGEAASIAKSRLDWLAGRQGEALVQLQGHLAQKRVKPAAQLLAFLIATDLSSGKTERAVTWIPIAERLKNTNQLEIAYWKARVAELSGKKPEAVELYRAAWHQAPYDPVAQGAWQRLASADLKPLAEARARQLSRSQSPADLLFAWHFLGNSDSAGVLARTALAGRLQQDPRLAPWLRLAPTRPADWPLWKTPPRTGEEMVAALGTFDDAPGAAGRFFPLTDSALGLAGSQALAAGGAHQRSLYLAELLAKRAPAALPAALLPEALRQRAYPLGYRPLLEGESRVRKIDPQLLAAIIREESRFNPDAFSGASARGLTQFILPTALDLAQKLSLGPLQALDLHRPEVAIRLGAAYLAELDKTFAGSLPPMVAAYNAGAPQARLWKSYTLTEDPVEYLAKVGFEETRNYLTKVLTSHAHYREIYRLELEPAARPPL